MEPLKSPLMSPEGKDLMRKWARDHGKCVKQRTVRQETTKYKAGTLPLNMYQTSDTLQSVGERIDHFTVVAKLPGLRMEASLPVTLF